MTTTRRLTLLVSATLFALGVLAGPALAMQPPAEAAADRFGCPNAVAGHPGAAGLVGALEIVVEASDGNSTTAWMAVREDNPIKLGTC